MNPRKRIPLEGIKAHKDILQSTNYMFCPGGSETPTAETLERLMAHAKSSEAPYTFYMFPNVSNDKEVETYQKFLTENADFIKDNHEHIVFLADLQKNPDWLAIRKACFEDSHDLDAALNADVNRYCDSHSDADAQKAREHILESAVTFLYFHSSDKKQAMIYPNDLSKTMKLAKGYDFRLMSELPNQDPNEAVIGKFYLGSDGKYVVCDPKGVVRTGSLPDTIQLNNLSTRINSEGLQKQILAHTSKPELNHTQDTSVLQKLGFKKDSLVHIAYTLDQLNLITKAVYQPKQKMAVNAVAMKEEKHNHVTPPKKESVELKPEYEASLRNEGVKTRAFFYFLVVTVLDPVHSSKLSKGLKDEDDATKAMFHLLIVLHDQGFDLETLSKMIDGPSNRRSQMQSTSRILTSFPPRIIVSPDSKKGPLAASTPPASVSVLTPGAPSVVSGGPLFSPTHASKLERRGSSSSLTNPASEQHKTPAVSVRV